MNGYIKSYRSLLEWEWWGDHNTARLWIYLLHKCSFKESKWRGMDVRPGQLITSLGTLTKETGVSTQSVRTSLNRLKSTGEITEHSTNQYRVITICNWETYQSVDEEDNKESIKPDNNPSTNRQQAANKQLTPSEEGKERKKVKKPPSGVEGDLIFKEIIPCKIPEKEAERKRMRVLKNLPVMEEIGAWFNRRSTTLWNVYEAKALKQLWPLDTDEYKMIRAYYRAERERVVGKLGRDWRRLNVETLLNNWIGELDRAQEYLRGTSEAAGASTMSDPLAGWETARDALCDEMEADGVNPRVIEETRAAVNFKELRSTLQADIKKRLNQS